MIAKRRYSPTFRLFILLCVTIFMTACKMPAPQNKVEFTLTSTVGQLPLNTPIMRSVKTPLLPVPAPLTEIAPNETTSLPLTPTVVVKSSLALGTPIPHLQIRQDIVLETIHMFSSQGGWATGGIKGADNHILKTNDSGRTWTDITPPQPIQTGVSQSALGYFIDLKTGWVIYNDLKSGSIFTPLVWRTSDSGQTWQTSELLDRSGLEEVFVPGNLQFIDPSTGWLLAHVGAGMNHDYVVLYQTTDGGVNWQRLLDPTNDGGIQSCQKTAMLFTDAQHGWLTGDCNGVAPGVLLFRTGDAGKSWQAVTLPEPSDVPGIFQSDSTVACGSYWPIFFDINNGKISVRCARLEQNVPKTDYYLYSTQDGGNHWAVAHYPGEVLIYSSPDTGWALSKLIYQTTDGGTTWKQISQVSWDAKFDFITDSLGWAVARAGEETALVQTENGGRTWMEIKPTIAER